MHRFLTAKQQLENERASNGINRRNDDVSELSVDGDLKLRKIFRPAFPTHLYITSHTVINPFSQSSKTETVNKGFDARLTNRPFLKLAG